MTTSQTTIEPRALTVHQVAELISRLSAAIVTAESMRLIHPVYAAEANAYRQVLATIEGL